MQNNIRQESILIKGVRFSYTAMSGEEPPLLFLHGWTCNRKFWNNQIEFFKGKRKAITIDFRGHGDSQITAEGNTIQQFAMDISAFIHNMGFRKVILIGHSMGGMVAQQFCVDYINQIKALVLVTTIAADMGDRLISKQIESDTPTYGYQNAFMNHFNDWFNPHADSDIVEWARDQMLKTPENVANSLVRSYRTFDLRSQLPKLHIPSLVVGARSDTSAIPKEAKTLALLISQSKLVMIDNSGHFPMLEQSERLNQELNNFLSSVSK